MPNAGIRNIVSLAAAALLAAAVVLPPAIYFVVSYEYAAGLLEAEAEINARIVSRVVASNPDLWQYEEVRLLDYLSRRPRRGDAERRRVLDAGGAVVAESADPLPTPWMTRSVPLLEAGAQVGALEISRSVRPLLLHTGVLAVGLLALGLVSFRAVRTVPLQIIRRSEETIRSERDTAQKYLDVAGVAFVIVDETGRVTLVNRKGTEILGRPEAEVLGRDWFATFVEPRERDRAASVSAAARPDDVVAVEYPVLRPTGERRIIAWYVSPLSDGGRRAGFLASGVDVTAQRQLEGQLLKAQKLEAIGQLAGGIAHDFNNVLSIIKGYAVLLQRTRDEARQRRYADQILASIDRGASLTRSLLTFGGRQVLHPGPLDLVELVRRLEPSLRRLLRADVELRTTFPPEALLVTGDPLQLERVLMNLVTNAQDAMPGGGRIAISALRTTLDAAGVAGAGLETPGTYAALSVTDSGTGIGAEAQAHLFEPFFTTKEAGRGTGLGLSISYAIMRQHRGGIRVASEPGHGATFTLLLPLVGTGAGVAAGPDAELPPPAGGTETVLIVDDDPSIRDMLRGVLEEAGYAVVEAVDGTDAVRRFEEHRDRVRLVILDVVMPGQNGKVALEEIRRIDPSARAMFLSGQMGAAPTGARPIHLGEELLFEKPAHPVELLRTVRRMLDA